MELTSIDQTASYSGRGAGPPANRTDPDGFDSAMAAVMALLAPGPGGPVQEGQTKGLPSNEADGGQSSHFAGEAGGGRQTVLQEIRPNGSFSAQGEPAGTAPAGLGDLPGYCPEAAPENTAPAPGQAIATADGATKGTPSIEDTGRPLWQFAGAAGAGLNSLSGDEAGLGRNSSVPGQAEAAPDGAAKGTPSIEDAGRPLWQAAGAVSAGSVREETAVFLQETAAKGNPMPGAQPTGEGYSGLRFPPADNAEPALATPARGQAAPALDDAAKGMPSIDTAGGSPVQSTGAAATGGSRQQTGTVLPGAAPQGSLIPGAEPAGAGPPGSGPLQGYVAGTAPENLVPGQAAAIPDGVTKESPPIETVASAGQAGDMAETASGKKGAGMPGAPEAGQRAPAGQAEAVFEIAWGQGRGEAERAGGTLNDGPSRGVATNEISAAAEAKQGSGNSPGEAPQPDPVQVNTAGIPQGSAKSQAGVALPDLKDALVREIRHFHDARKDAPARIQLKLEPESLGKLTISISYSKGALNAHFYTGSEHVREILQGSLQQLRENLGRQELTLDQAFVFVSGENSGDSAGNRTAYENRRDGYFPNSRHAAQPNPAPGDYRRQDACYPGVNYLV